MHERYESTIRGLKDELTKYCRQHIHFKIMAGGYTHLLTESVSAKKIADVMRKRYMDVEEPVERKIEFSNFHITILCKIKKTEKRFELIALSITDTSWALKVIWLF